MTRINLIPVRQLTNKHLLAEYRELPRVYRLAREWHNRGCPGGIPETYCLGKGHVRFFYNKLKWVTNRWHKLYRECKRRGFDVKHKPRYPFINAPKALWNDWAPDKQSILLNRERIKQRIKEASYRGTERL